MKYDILGVPQAEYKKGIAVRIIICVAVAFVAVLANILLTVFRTDSTHVAFLIVNILSDVIAFCFIFFFVSTQILFRKKLYKLAVRSGEKISGEITGISELTETVNGLECYEISLQDTDLKKVFLAKEGAVPYDLNGKVKVTIVDNIVVEAEVQS